jgi:hypothetical protein
MPSMVEMIVDIAVGVDAGVRVAGTDVGTAVIVETDVGTPDGTTDACGWQAASRQIIRTDREKFFMVIYWTSSIALRA